MATDRFDITEIKRALAIYHPPSADGYFEIRALRVAGHGIVSGIFGSSEIEKAARAAENLSGQAYGVYFTPNAVSPQVRKRAPGRLVDHAKRTTADKEITRRSWLLGDCDAVRASNISSTDTEHEAALKRARDIAGWLVREHQFPAPVLADSGNGGHATWRIDLPNCEATTELVRQFLEALDRRYSDDVVKVDTSVHNAARIWKLPGTLVCKGDNTPERPHRLARIVKVPKTIELVTREMLQAVIDAYAPPPRVSLNGKGKRDAESHDIVWPDIRPYVAARITKEKAADNGATIVEISGCPFGDDHPDDYAGYLTVFANGNTVPRCHHDHCKNKSFADFLKANAPALLKELEKHPLARIKSQFTRDASEIDGDGERLRLSADELRQVQKAITKKKLWHAAAALEWLIKDHAFENYFTRDQGGKLYVYDHGVYRGTGDERIRALLKSVMPDELWASNLPPVTSARIEADAPYLWERPPLDVLNLQNGLLDVHTRELRAHSPKHLSLVQLPIRYDPSAKCPAWEKQVKETFPRDAMEAGVPWQILAWLMIPNVSLQKALLLVGPGGCGRSRFLTGARNFLGGDRNVSAIPLETLEHHRFAAAGLVGKLANICPDLPPTRLRASSTFKRLTDGADPVHVEEKYRKPYDAHPFARLVFSANIPPASEDATDAFFQRWLVIQFSHVYRQTPQEIKPHIIDGWLSKPDELSGALNRALIALPGVLERGLTVTTSMVAAHEEFQKLTDPLAIWLRQNTVEGPNLFVARSALIEAYNAHARAEGRYEMGNTEFGLALDQLRPNIKGKDKQRTVAGVIRTWCYIGIGLKAEAEI